MLVLLMLHMLAVLLAPAMVKVFRRKAFLVLACAPASVAAWALWHTSAVLSGNGPTQRQAWLPHLGLELSFRLDTLSWLMSLIVGGIGALVLIYCTRYFSLKATSLGRFASVFTGFAGSMFGLVTTDNTIALFIFWEFTTVFSFLLIGHYYTRQASRRAAMEAIVSTSIGGLAMLGGFTMLSLANAGSFTISELVESARNGALMPANSSTYVNTAVTLVLLGALTKAAQVPFHYWLPAAMAAPTPVSAYLHAAAMVKAGVYLVARLAPGFATLTSWQAIVVTTGMATMLIGGYRSLRQHDLKLVLAYGTVSQLGFILVLVGHGSRSVALAGLTMIASHATFKACLFLTVGVIDQTTGTRDLRELSGLGRSLPLLAITSGFAVASMAGIPPTVGFIAKEAAFAGFIDSNRVTDTVVLAALVAGSILTCAYGLRWWWGAFAPKPGVEQATPKCPSVVVLVSPTLLGFLSLASGLFPHGWEDLLSPHADLYPGKAGHLSLWAGFNVPLLFSVFVTTAGAIMFWQRALVERVQEAIPPVQSADKTYRLALKCLNNVAADVTSFFQRGSLPAYLATIFTVTIAVVWTTIAFTGLPWPNHFRWWDSYLQVGLAAVICVTAVLLITTRQRMKAVLLLGLIGYCVALLFAAQGAPDLALTQAIVETVALVVFILVLRRMPPTFVQRPHPLQRWLRILLGLIVGLTTAAIGVIAANARIHPPVTVDYPNEVYEFGYGKNIVNVTLVDTRAWDTLGEISVLLAAATGIASLIFARAHGINALANVYRHARQNRTVWQTGKTDPAAPLWAPKDASLRSPRRGQEWLSGPSTLSPDRRSVIMELGARMIFHAMLLFSLFLLFSGHNAPGGGFAGGMVAGIALIVRYLAGGRFELLAAVPISAGVILGSGMTISTLAALTPVALGGTILQTTVFDFSLPLFGEIHLATALFFDIGVYFIVLGLVLDILRSLGGQIDVHAEAEGEQAPDIRHDDPTILVSDTVSPIDLRARVEAAAEALTSGGAESS